MSSSFITELWVEYAVGIGAFFLRFFARWKTVGFRGFALDDLFCGFGVILYTLDAALTYTYGTKGSAVGLTVQTSLELDPETLHNFEIGEKSLFFAWICYICLTWSLKAVLLSLYNRLTLGLWQHKLVKYVAIFCAFSWSICIIFHFAMCVPIQRAFQVSPYPGDNCVLRKPNHALVAALNILSDVGILTIPLPILCAARIPIGRKIILGALFTSGTFVIVTVVLRLVYSLGDIGSLPTAASWALRETFVSVMTVTAPGIKPLFSRAHWLKSSSYNNSQSEQTKGTRGTRSLFKSNPGHSTTVTGSHADESGRGRHYELSSGVGWPRKNAKKDGMEQLDSDTASQEHIISPRGSKNQDNAIHVVTEYRLDHEGSDEDLRVSNDGVNIFGGPKHPA